MCMYVCVKEFGTCLVDYSFRFAQSIIKKLKLTILEKFLNTER